MKKAFEAVASFIRWVVTGVISFVIALPTYTSLSTSM